MTSLSKILSLKDANNFVYNRNNLNLSDLINDSRDFEIKSGTVFNESFYYTIDTLSDKLNDKTGNFNVLNLNIDSLNAK